MCSKLYVSGSLKRCLGWICTSGSCQPIDQLVCDDPILQMASFRETV